MTYSIDTSAILDGWVRHYPIDVFPRLWANLDSLIRENRLWASGEVIRELAAKDDDVFGWAKQRLQLIVELDEDVQAATSEILAVFQTMVDTMKGRSRADPFVIAVARVRGCTVVTGEKNTGTRDRPRIPLVCQHFGVPCIDLLGLIRAERWRF
ncbi:MAG: DUF4411 family protein [Thermoleophilia bacterium]|nr:DUF4411 family protein [Thermoleophilia bacterium]